MTAIPSARKSIRAATAAFALLLTVVSLMPSGAEDSGSSGWDTAISPALQNTLHVPAYLVLTVLAIGCLSMPGRGRILGVAAVCAGFGVILELGQAYVPGRTGSVADMLLNTLGAILGVTGARLWIRRRGSIGESASATDCVLAQDDGGEGSP